MDKWVNKGNNEKKKKCITMATDGKGKSNKELYDYLKEYGDIGGDFDVKKGITEIPNLWKPPPGHRCIR